MSDMNVEPDELRDTARTLNTEAETAREIRQTIALHFDSISTVWRDRQRDKFAETFQENQAALNQVAILLDDFAAYLRHKADLVDDYLNS